MLNKDPEEKAPAPPRPSRTEDPRTVAAEYADDQRAIAEKLRRTMN